MKSASNPRVLDRLSVDLVAVTRDGVGLALLTGPPPHFMTITGCRPDDAHVTAEITDVGVISIAAKRAPGDDEEEEDALDDDDES